MAPKLKLTSQDKGDKMSVKVTAEATGYSQATVTSKATATVAG